MYMRNEKSIDTNVLGKGLCELRDHLPGATEAQQQFAGFLAMGRPIDFCDGPKLVSGYQGLPKVRVITPSHLKYYVDSCAKELHHDVVGTYVMGWASRSTLGKEIVMDSNFKEQVAQIVSAIDNNGLFSQQFAELYR